MATLELVPIVAFFLGAASAFAGFVSGLLAMRAKTRAKVVLARKSEFSRYRKLADASKRPTEAEIDRLSDSIAKILKSELSEGDQRRVYQGLHQMSKIGEWRYISTLLH